MGGWEGIGFLRLFSELWQRGDLKFGIYVVLYPILSKALLNRLTAINETANVQVQNLQ